MSPQEESRCTIAPQIDLRVKVSMGVGSNTTDPSEVSTRVVEGELGSFRVHSPLHSEASSPVRRAAQEGPWFPVVSRKPQEWPVIMALKRAPAFRLIYLSARLSCISSLLAYFVLYLVKGMGRERGQKRSVFAGHFDITGTGIALAWRHFGNMGLPLIFSRSEDNRK